MASEHNRSGVLDWDEVDRNPFFSGRQKAKALEAYLDAIRKRGSSIGCGHRGDR